jgi:predicted nucleic acid-binding protein
MSEPGAGLGRHFVWDSSALHHVGKAGRLDVLGSFVTGTDTDPWAHYVTEVVVQELAKYGIEAPCWCTVVSATELTDVLEFARWAGLMSDGIHDLGEASVAAWAFTHNCVAVIDDRDARSVAVEHGCQAHGSLWLLCECIGNGTVDVHSASTFADSAKAAGARFPFEPRGFQPWAVEVGLLPSR